MRHWLTVSLGCALSSNRLRAHAASSALSPSLAHTLAPVAVKYFSSPNPHPFLQPHRYEFLTRELLWHGFTELLLFILPLIDVRRVTGIYRRIVGRLQALVVTFLRQRLGLQIGSSESTAAAVGAANPADSTPDPTPDHHTKGGAAPVLQSCAICSHRPAQSAYQTASCAHHFCYACIADATQVRSGLSE